MSEESTHNCQVKLVRPRLLNLCDGDVALPEHNVVYVSQRSLLTAVSYIVIICRFEEQERRPVDLQVIRARWKIFRK